MSVGGGRGVGLGVPHPGWVGGAVGNTQELVQNQSPPPSGCAKVWPLRVGHGWEGCGEGQGQVWGQGAPAWVGGWGC